MLAGKRGCLIIGVGIAGLAAFALTPLTARPAAAAVLEPAPSSLTL